MEPVIAGHPLHPILVTLPVGLLSSSYVLDLLALTTGNDSLAEAAYYNMVMGWVGSLPAAATGYLDYRQMEQDDPAQTTTSTHGWLNAGIMSLYTVNLLIRRNNKRSKLGLLLSTFGAAGLAVSGYLGGEIAFGRGWRVRSAERFELAWQKEHGVGPFAPKNGATSSEKYPPETVKGMREKRSGEAVLKEIQQTPVPPTKTTPAASPATSPAIVHPVGSITQPLNGTGKVIQLDPTDRPSQAEGDRDTIESDLQNNSPS